jgi:uncharacterized membrane protein
MTRKIVLFAALLFAALAAGGGYVVWWDYNPGEMSPAFYTEKMQYAIRTIGTPLFAVVGLGTFFTIISALLARRDRPHFYFLIGASICFFTVAMITNFGNIPILDQIKTWNISSPPSNWKELADKWWLIHNVRFAVQITGLSLLIWAVLGRRTNEELK